ncbi:dihydroorotate dehydrogenase electron transfer subunit [Roseibium aggregatum]|uniref:Dihydroorotate oxidase B, electron transfer subunit n=1 Tax=Roseibium aggregatum TaxID=187304 RepID=A0A0M6YBH9_9HYPH|nr:dihydroorotate dehydrogenase electron transfer subunit [Roseibium aggregatum]CTQ47446.1 Dihydroorotate oxidase B, electron transfer subunit [Roseibium aggregatum]
MLQERQDTVAPDEFTAFQMRLEVKHNAPVNGEYRTLVLNAPKHLLDLCRPGQFFNLLCPQTGGETPYLRRPMSIYGFYPERNELHFLYKVTGAGTRALSVLRDGDDLDVFGPLGTPFSIEDHWRHLVLVARGVGLATLAPLALEANRLDRKLTAVCSARHPDFLMSTDYFRQLGAEVIAVTDSDGSSGLENLRAILENLIARRKADAFFTCGSNRMLRLLQQIGETHGIPGQIALEQQMACGIGMCQCCVRPFRRDHAVVNLRVCLEGPVFDIAEAIAW